MNVLRHTWITELNIASTKVITCTVQHNLFRVQWNIRPFHCWWEHIMNVGSWVWKSRVRSEAEGYKLASDFLWRNLTVRRTDSFFTVTHWINIINSTLPAVKWVQEPYSLQENSPEYTCHNRVLCKLREISNIVFAGFSKIILILIRFGQDMWDFLS
jgi:hypothetical protein